jgi:hypothetical protein
VGSQWAQWWEMNKEWFLSQQSSRDETQCSWEKEAEKEGRFWRNNQFRLSQHLMREKFLLLFIHFSCSNLMSSFFGTSAYAVDSLSTNTVHCHVSDTTPFSLLGTLILPSHMLQNGESDGFQQKRETEAGGVGARGKVAELVWISYRTGFPPLPGVGLVCDSGWGCMYRTVQMMLANTMLLKTTGLWPSRRHVLQYFLDLPTALLSIHSLVTHAEVIRKRAGQWICPSEAAYVLSAAVDNDVSFPLTVHIARNSVFSLPDILARARATGAFRPVVLIAPIRLGLDDINDIYIPSIYGEKISAFSADLFFIIFHGKLFSLTPPNPPNPSSLTPSLSRVRVLFEFSLRGYCGRAAGVLLLLCRMPRRQAVLSGPPHHTVRGLSTGLGGQ